MEETCDGKAGFDNDHSSLLDCENESAPAQVAHHAPLTREVVVVRCMRQNMGPQMLLMLALRTR